MSHTEFDKDGNPVFAIVSSAIITSVKNESQITVPSPSSERDVTVGKTEVAPWFDPNNDYPNIVAANYLTKSEALVSAIDYKSRVCLSQGFYPVRVIDIDVDGVEKFEVVKDPNLNKFLRSPMIRRFALNAFRSIYSMGMAFPQTVLRKDGTIYSVDTFKPKNCRFEKRKKDKSDINNLLIMPDWSKPSEDDLQTISILNQQSWDIAETIEAAKKLKKFCYPLSLGSIINNYYSEAPWDVSRNSGTLDISLKIVEYLDKMFTNQISPKYLIKIPYAYWEKKFPISDYPTPELMQKRQTLIEAEIDKIEKALTEPKNAGKAIITMFEIGRNGNAEEQWIIEVIDDKFKNDQYLPHAATMNTSIYNSMGLDPTVRGLSVAAGPYANNQGGSNKREAFLIDIALSWADRQEVNDFIELLVKLQFPKLQDVEIRNRIMVLTTLDTGSQTKAGTI